MYSFTSKVRYSELAEDKKLSIVSIINYFQDVSNFESEEKGVGLKWLTEQGNVWMLTSWQIKIDRRPKLAEEITATTWASDFRHFIGKRCFKLTDAAGEVIAYAMSDWAYVNMETSSPAKVPQKELDAYGIAEPFKADFDKGRIKLPESLKEEAYYVIRLTNIDTNHHVNNGQYIAICEEFLPGEFEVSGLRAEYKGQSRLGDVLVPKTAETEKGYIVILYGQAGDLRVICEFKGKKK